MSPGRSKFLDYSLLYKFVETHLVSKYKFVGYSTHELIMGSDIGSLPLRSNYLPEARVS